MNHFIKHASFLVSLLLLASCSPKLMLPDLTPVVTRDTITQVTERTVTDTVLLAGETLEVHDTFPCPPGLTKDSLIYRTKTVYLPGKTITVEVPVRDTVRIVESTANLPAYPTDGGWPERIGWLSAVALLLFGFWRKWKKEQVAALIIGLVCILGNLGAQGPYVLMCTDSGHVKFINGTGAGSVRMIYRKDTVIVETKNFTLPDHTLQERAARTVQLLQNGRLTWSDFLNLNKVNNSSAMRNYYGYARKVRKAALRKIPDPVLIDLERMICVNN